ncbi:MAG: carboxypeptidase regulatory-like domain-containing protein [Chloroflexi bacterium]|nr:carboxypeptidase regulatory-like domain-containing protein [Chloroflexota bacterium]
MKSQIPNPNLQAPIAAFFILLCAVAFVLPFSHSVSAQSAAAGKIEGQLVNASKDAPINSTANLTVTLFSAAANATAPITSTTRSDASGRFSFSNLDTLPETRYLVLANYAGVDYYSDLLTFAVNQSSIPITMTLRETTTDPAALRVNQTHFIIDVGAGVLDVIQVIIVQNPTDRTFVGKSLTGPHRATLTLPILADARNVRFERADADATTLRDASALTYTLPFFPGDEQIVFTYEIPFTPPTYPFNLTMPFASAQFRILLSDVGGKIDSPQLSAPTSFAAQNGAKYLVTTATNLTANQTIRATFTNLPGDAAPSARGGEFNSPVVAGGVIGVTGLATGALLVLALTRRRVNRTRQELIEMLADLDEGFEAGKMSAGEYRAERARVKEELMAETFEVSETSKV